MPACSAIGCTNRTGETKIRRISFHRFPKNPLLRNQWIAAVRRKDWLPSNISVLCSKHFREDQLDRFSKVKVRVKENEVPSVFPGFPSYLQKKIKHRKSPLQRTSIKASDLESLPNAALETAPNAALETAPNATIETELKAEPNATLERELNATMETIPNAAMDTTPSATTETNSSATIKINSNTVIKTEPNATLETELNSIMETIPNASLEATPTVAENNLQNDIRAECCPLRQLNMKRKLEKAEKSIQKYRKQVVALKQSNRQMKQKLTDFRKLFEYLKELKLLDKNDASNNVKLNANPNMVWLQGADS